MSKFISSQAEIFVLGLVIGAALGIAYDIFKTLRLIGFNSKICVFIEDILFFLISTFAFFSFYMQFTEGKFRIYPILSGIIGFCIYFFTVEKFVFYIVKKIYYLIALVISFVLKKMFFPIVKFVFKPFKFISILFSKFIKRIYEKFVKYLKKLLQKLDKMLYNILKVKRKEGEKSCEKAFFC